jgi:hypothetical protein
MIRLASHRTSARGRQANESCLSITTCPSKGWVEMKHTFKFILLPIAAAASIVSCGGAAGTPADPVATCGSPPPVAIAQLWLAYPVPNATSVPTSIGEIVLAGNPYGRYGTDTITIASSAAQVPVGAFTAPPSPLPSPYATPPQSSGNVPYFAVPVGTLSTGTTYTVSFTYTDWADNPPTCTQQITKQLGSFST